MQLKRINDSFGARITGISIAEGVSNEQWAEIERHLAVYPVLGFPNQVLTDDQQSDFIHSRGPAFKVLYSEAGRAQNTDDRLVDIANMEQDGSAFSPAKAMFYDANMLWHTDGSFNVRPVRITTLSARVLPKDPPPTEYADMRAAWDALPRDMQAQCEGLYVRHSVLYSRRRMGLDESGYSEEYKRSRGTPSRQPLVRVHPVSRRKSLYLSSHMGTIDGWTATRSAEFIEELMSFATQSQFVLSYQWGPHDLVMWDDRCTMHRATPYSRPEPRMLRWASITEEAPLCAQEPEPLCARDPEHVST
jgi:alpha-ketoglutarate-dependent 2,4-dichlorophenoxyacetate dioxygenase